MNGDSKWPTTLDEAVDELLSKMSDEGKQKLKDTPRNKLIRLHHGFGTQIRNNMGMWAGNMKLVLACGSIHPDGASMRIIEAAWERLQG